MQQKMIPRILIILLIGIGLFSTLLYITSFCESRYLKRRSKVSMSNQKKIKTGVFMIYIFILISIIFISFFVITLDVRSIQ